MCHSRVAIRKHIDSSVPGSSAPAPGCIPAPGALQRRGGLRAHPLAVLPSSCRIHPYLLLFFPSSALLVPCSTSLSHRVFWLPTGAGEQCPKHPLRCSHAPSDTSCWSSIPASLQAQGCSCRSLQFTAVTRGGLSRGCGAAGWDLPHLQMKRK